MSVATPVTVGTDGNISHMTSAVVGERKSIYHHVAYSFAEIRRVVDDGARRGCRNFAKLGGTRRRNVHRDMPLSQHYIQSAYVIAVLMGHKYGVNVGKRLAQRRKRGAYRLAAAARVYKHRGFFSV